MSRPITPMRLWASVGTALVVGVFSGAATASQPIIQAPSDCAKAFTAAEQVFTTKENAATSLHHRATRGQSEYDRHDADVKAAWKHEAELMGVYRDAKAECVGADR